MGAEFRVGQEVVCVLKGRWRPARLRDWVRELFRPISKPVYGGVYEIAELDCGDEGLFLGFREFECTYLASHFRPVVNKPLEHLIDIAARPDAPLKAAPEGPRRREKAPAHK